MAIQDIIKQVEALKELVPSQTELIINNAKDVILDLIREKQLYEKGIDGSGQPLEDYSSYTVAIKRQKGQPTDRTTLEDEGDFYKAFDLFFTDQFAIGVFSRDVKTPKLVEKYGSDIFLFTVDNNKILNEEIILPKLYEWLLKELGNIKI